MGTWLYLVAMAVSGLESTIVAPALPDMATQLRTDVAGIAAVEWVFLVASALSVPAAAWASRRFGALRVVGVCLTVFTVALVVAALANHLVLLCVARAVQGASSGLLTPVLLAFVYDGADGPARLRIARLTTVPLTIAPMLGPVLGGFLTTHLGWRSVFVAVAPFGVVAIGLALAASRVGAAAPPGRPTVDDSSGCPGVDAVGLALLAVTLGGLSSAVAAWSADPVLVRPWMPALAVVSCVTGVAAAHHLRRVPHPAVDLTLWRVPTFAAAGAVTCASAAALMGVLIVTPLTLMSQGVSGARIGLVMVPETFGLLVGSLLLRPVLTRLGARRVALVGLGCAAPTGCVVVGFGWWGAGVGTGAMMLLFGVSLSLPVLLAQAAAFADVAPGRTGEATGLFMMQRTLAGSVGVVACAGVAAFAPAATSLVVALALAAAALAAVTLDASRWQAATTA